MLKYLFTAEFKDGSIYQQTPEDVSLTDEQNLRVARLAKTLDLQGFDVIVSTICPYKDLREEVQKITGCRFIYLDGGRSGVQYPYER